MFEIFPKLWEIISEAKPIEQIGLILGLIPIVGTIWGLVYARIGMRSARQQLTNANERIKILEQNRDDAIRAQKAAEAERDALSPDHWLRVAYKEQAQGNEEKAMAVLAQGFAVVRAGMAHTALALAGDHLGQVIGPDRAFHLTEGERFARIATLLDPDDPDAAALAEEAAMERIDDGEDVDIPELHASHLPSDPSEAKQLIQTLCNHADRKMREGHYQLGHRLARRAVLVSRRAGQYDQEEGCRARFWVAQMLRFKGDSRAVADIIAALLSSTERVMGAEHRHVLSVRCLEAQNLRSLGEYEAAREKVTALLPIHERVLGAEHPHVLVTRYLEARILDDLGEYQTAREKIIALLPVIERVLGAEHMDVLDTRHLEAHILNNLGEYEAAREKIIALLPIHERVLGAEHPYVLGTRHLEIKILNSLGEYEAAREKITTLLPIRERVMGADHPRVIDTRITRDKILANIAQGDAPATPAD